MPRLTQQKHFRECKSLPFCYLCGHPLDQDQEVNRDHVPPKNIFTKDHRGNPLILPTHEACNTSQSGYDEAIGQLVAVLHRKRPRRDFVRRHIRVAGVSPVGGAILILEGLDLKRIVWRWVKGFHAALYKECLPLGIPSNVHLPMQAARELDGKLDFEPILVQQRMIANELKKNRQVGNLDRIRCYSGKCLYEAVWVRSDKGQWLCLFGIRIYNWETLGDTRFRGRGCAGFYMPPEGKPEDAAAGTLLEFPSTGGNPLDPFV